MIYLRLFHFFHKGVPVEASILLYKYYIANKEHDREYVLLPQQNFNAYFGNTNFSQKWIAALKRNKVQPSGLLSYDRESGLLGFLFWMHLRMLKRRLCLHGEVRTGVAFFIS